MELKAPLTKVWELFDFPCGQRLAPILREQMERLRTSGGLTCSQKVAGMLLEISPRTIDRLLAREREVRCLKQHRRPPVHPLLYQRMPVKTAAEWDRQESATAVGLRAALRPFDGRANICMTFSATDIATGWWEGECNWDAPRRRRRRAWSESAQRMPFRIREVHPDNDSGIINDLMWNY